MVALILGIISLLTGCSKWGESCHFRTVEWDQMDRAIVTQYSIVFVHPDNLSGDPMKEDGKKNRTVILFPDQVKLLHQSGGRRIKATVGPVECGVKYQVTVRAVNHAGQNDSEPVQ